MVKYKDGYVEVPNEDMIMILKAMTKQKEMLDLYKSIMEKKDRIINDYETNKRY